MYNLWSLCFYPSNLLANELHSSSVVSLVILHSITKLKLAFKRYTNKQYLWLQLLSRASVLLMWSAWHQRSPSGLRSTARQPLVTIYKNKHNVNLYRVWKTKLCHAKLSEMSCWAQSSNPKQSLTVSSNKIAIINLFHWHSHAHDRSHASMQHTIRNFLLKCIMGLAVW